MVVVWDGRVCSCPQGVPPSEKLFIGRNFNGHIGSTTGGYDEVHGGFGFGERNGGGTSLLDFAKAFGLVIANSIFSKRDKHLVTYQNTVAHTQIDYLLLRRRDRGFCKDCKVIPGEILVTWHRLLVMDVGIMVKRRKISARGRPRIREAVREVLGVSTGISGSHKGDWWWNKVVQGKVKAKKEAYRSLVESIGEEERRACIKRYKVARKEAKLAVT
uniref:Craniofacial development protein 2-like n=1 Tax=Nicotiana tabacum TaxID=4097 RepID=A0A1S3Y2T5_TOBAC|nr:PREDICTED: craniofacial development protein 2-like [Nicotiana tabacum]